MIQIRKHNSSPLASCPYCNAQVRHDRIEKHILKVHQSKNNKRGIRKQCFLSKVQSEKAIFYNQLNFYSKQISDWLDKHLANCYSITEAEVLTIMFVIEHLKYKKSELSKLIEK